MGLPSRSAPPPRAAHQRDPSAGADTTPELDLAADLERDERRPHRYPAGVPLGAVDRVDDPTPVAGAGAGRADSSPTTASPGRASASRSRIIVSTARSASVTGVQVGLGLHHEIIGPEARQGDRIGGVGEHVREREVSSEVRMGGDAGNVAPAAHGVCRPRRCGSETGAIGAPPLAATVDDLVAGASSRTPLTVDDSKSGARFERVVVDGEPFVLKHLDRRDDWIMRQTGDVGCVPVRIWESGVFDLLPECIDHTTVGAARDADRGCGA